MELYNEYKDQGLEIFAFPCNQFARHEPGTDKEIKEFATSQKATFPLFAKTEVNGPDSCETYKFLRGNSELINED